MKIWAVTLAFAVLPLQGFAAPTIETRDDAFFSYHILKHPESRRGLFWRPFVSILVPGLDQWMEGQYRAAAVYSGYATVGVLTAFSAVKTTTDANGDSHSEITDDRRYMWGNQAYMDAGFVSAFHSFRKAAETRKPQGQFLFLKHEETAGDLMLAPLHFEYLIRPSVFIPLALLGGLIAVESNNSSHAWKLEGSDVGFAGAVSYNAGVGEEAFFRGYMMPVFREAWGSDFWSNTMTATIFGAAHISASNPIPWPQFLMGMYLGWRTQRNEWRMSESVFIHTWWDVLAISAQAAADRGQRIYVPLINAQF